jgi:hypothetical protein
MTWLGPVCAAPDDPTARPQADEAVFEAVRT